MIHEFNWTVFGTAAGLALIAVGAGLLFAYGQVRRYDPAAAASPPPEFLVRLFLRFTRAAHACLGAGAAVLATAFLSGPHWPDAATAPAPITLLYAGVLGFLLAILTCNVLRHRVRALLYSFGRPDPLAERIVRVHGNFAEYVPTGLVLLLALELAAAPAAVVHFGGAAFTIGRCLHAWGYTRRDGASFGRIAGIQITLFALAYLVIAAALYLFFL